MSGRITCGTIGAIGGAALTFAAILLTTGSYKEKVDTTAKTVVLHEGRLTQHDGELSSLKAKVDSNAEMLREVRADIKELLKRTE